MINEQEKIIKKFEYMSEKYHKLSLLFYELSQSLKIKSKNTNPIKFKKYIKEELNLNIEKIRQITKGIIDLELNNLQNKSD
jgi:hypothetical protein